MPMSTSDTVSTSRADNEALKGKVTNLASDVAERAAEEFERAASRIEDAAKRASARGQQASENFQEVASNFRGAFDKSLQEQPVATIAAVAGVAFILGALWKSR